MRFRSKAPAFLDVISGELKDKDVENRLLALGIIRGLGPNADKVAPEILKLLEDPDMRVKVAAISTLGAIKSPSTTVMVGLEKALKDKDYRTRVAAINALKALGESAPAKVTPVLEQALSSESYDPVKRLITAAVEELKKTKSSSH
ncbi:MAG: HEAT repeat domain-containing protein [Desulfomonilaceae bacterium]